MEEKVLDRRGHDGRDVAQKTEVFLSERRPSLAGPQPEDADHALSSEDGRQQGESVAVAGPVPGFEGHRLPGWRVAQGGRCLPREAPGSPEHQLAVLVPHEEGPPLHPQLPHDDQQGRVQGRLAGVAPAQGVREIQERDELRQALETRGLLPLGAEPVDGLAILVDHAHLKGRATGPHLRL